MHNKWEMFLCNLWSYSMCAHFEALLCVHAKYYLTCYNVLSFDYFFFNKNYRKQIPELLERLKTMEAEDSPSTSLHTSISYAISVWKHENLCYFYIFNVGLLSTWSDTVNLAIRDVSGARYVLEKQKICFVG